MTMSEFRLTTERCVLRDVTDADVEHVWTAAHSPGFTEGMTWEPPKDHGEIHAYNQKLRRQTEEGIRRGWTIETKDGTFVGRIETERDHDLPGVTWGIGYWIHPTQQGKGYATEAAKEVVRFLFEGLDADSIVSSHADWNEASGKVLHKIGMKHTGFSDDRSIKKGKPRRMAEFWLDRKDWNPT